MDQEAILAYLSDGRRLRNDNIRELAGAQDQVCTTVSSSYQFLISLLVYLCFQQILPRFRFGRGATRAESRSTPTTSDGRYACEWRSLLYPGTNICVGSIAATPPFRPSQLATSYLRIAHTHHDYINHTLMALHCQHEAVRIASSSLDLNVLAITDAFDSISAGARGELDKQAALLAGLEADLELISKVRIHVEFMSPAVRKAIEGGEKSRTLGDYVSIVKMKQVAETCARTHGE